MSTARLAGRDDLGKVDRAAARVLADLFAAAESVGDKDGLGSSGADGGQQHAFTERLRDSKFLALEAEGAKAGGGAAPGGVDGGDVYAWIAEQVAQVYPELAVKDADGQILEAHSISAGLDYPGAGPQHAFLRDSGRARYVAVTDREALDAFRAVARSEGIIPALETAHALAWVLAQAGGELDLVCLSGRGDKDLAEVLAQS